MIENLCDLLALQGPEGDSEKWKQKHKKFRKEVEGNTERTPEGVMRMRVMRVS